jgi:phosphoserine phosphatase
MAGIRDLWRRAQAVCFDVDSTVSPEEGIDVLAAFAGKGDAVAQLTRRAMSGSVPFQDALKARLDLIRPSRELIDDCLRAHPPRLTPGVAQLVAALHARGTKVYLVSGGFEPMIMPLAQRLGIVADQVHANAIRFTADGEYAGFDADRPTARSGGKAAVLGRLKQRFAYAPLIMVGDGATDLEARPPADGFIGYGGVVVREKVKAAADWFVTDFAELIDAMR